MTNLTDLVTLIEKRQDMGVLSIASSELQSNIASAGLLISIEFQSSLANVKFERSLVSGREDCTVRLGEVSSSFGPSGATERGVAEAELNGDLVFRGNISVFNKSYAFRVPSVAELAQMAGSFACMYYSEENK